MSTFIPLNQAAARFGFASGAALRKGFQRGNLPADCLLRVGPRTLRVDVEKLEVWLRNQPAYRRRASEVQA